jgi:hypothetical protein
MVYFLLLFHDTLIIHKKTGKIKRKASRLKPVLSRLFCLVQYFMSYVLMLPVLPEGPPRRSSCRL